MSRAIVCLATLLACLPVPMAGQSPTSLDRVDDLARLGRTEEARVVLLEWWGSERSRASRSDLQRSLWLRGRLTVDPSQAELDFRRLVVEYPGGRYSGPALLRLAQSALAAGDSAAAAGYVDRLVVEYPTTAARRDAEEWLSQIGSLPETNADPPAVSEPEEPVVERAVEAPPPTATHAVQLGAFAGEERARTLLRRAADAGLEPRLVRVGESGLIHVRVGLFPSSEAAAVVARRVQELGFAAAVVRDVDREEPVR